jgi:hypothetical protein
MTPQTLFPGLPRSSWEYPRGRTRFWRISVGTLSTGVEIWTHTSDAFQPS